MFLQIKIKSVFKIERLIETEILCATTTTRRKISFTTTVITVLVRTSAVGF